MHRCSMSTTQQVRIRYEVPRPMVSTQSQPVLTSRAKQINAIIAFIDIWPHVPPGSYIGATTPFTAYHGITAFSKHLHQHGLHKSTYCCVVGATHHDGPDGYCELSGVVDSQVPPCLQRIAAGDQTVTVTWFRTHIWQTLSCYIGCAIFSDTS